MDVLVSFAPYVISVVLVVVAFIGLRMLRGWVNSATSPTEEMIAWAAVAAVEQMFFDKDGAFKKEEAKKFIRAYFPNLDEVQMNMWIESAVKLMNDGRIIE